MYVAEMSTHKQADLQTPTRNHYFYGKLLDKYHFELETRYHNDKRWLINRLILGYGVVCGLDVKAAPSGDGIVVTPGFAIDGYGREIIVPETTGPHSIPPELLDCVKEAAEQKEKQSIAVQSRQAKGHGLSKTIHVLICYHECLSDPARVMTGDSCSSMPCEPSTIRERYRLAFKPGKAPEISMNPCMPDFISGGKINYALLAEYVTRSCRAKPANPCIPLAEIELFASENWMPQDAHIDITVRPVNFANDLLFELLISLMKEDIYRRVK